MDGEDDAWFDRELAGCSFVDERLNKRLRKLVAQIGSAMGQSIPLVCQDWANTKAAYRFLSNDRASEADISPTFNRRGGSRSPPLTSPPGLPASRHYVRHGGPGGRQEAPSPSPLLQRFQR